MIELNHITKTYPHKSDTVTALNNVSLSIRPNEVYGIIGMSGAGKSTLLRCINLLEKPDTGTVIIENQTLTDMSPSQLRHARSKIGMIFQHFNLLSSRTVFDNIALPLVIAKKPKPHIQSRVKELLQLVNLENKAQHHPNQLSGGQKQRVAIARALANDCHVLLCDEATSALDPESTKNILALLNKIRNQLNVTIVLITHEMEVIKAICDRVAVIDHGSIIEENDVEKLFSNPKTDLAKNLIHSTIKQALPSAIQANLSQRPFNDSLPMLRLCFLDGSAADPVISQWVRKFNFDVNIIQANIEHIKHHAVGVMTVTVNIEHSRLDECITFLKEQHVNVEVLGYVPRNVMAIN
ncbi:MAG: methionine ABC transporter ATP-binding protein [Gammaproteobacteria bacterium]